MLSILNGQTLLEYESIYNEISKEKFEKFLNHLFETLFPTKKNLDRNIFNKLFPKIPYFPKMKLFDYLLKKNKHESHLISIENIIETLIIIIFGSIEDKINFVTKYFSFNNDNKIYYKDVKLIFFYFHIFTLRLDNIDLDKIINDFFKGKEFLSKKEFLNLIKTENSNLFYLLLFSFNKTLFSKNDIKIIEHNIHLNYNKTYTQVSFLYENLSNPSKELFNYINDNYNLFLDYYDETKEIEDFNELNSFENDFKAFRSTLMSSNNLSEDEDFNIEKNKKNQKSKSFKNKTINTYFLPNIKDYKNKSNSPNIHFYNTCLNKKIKGLNFHDFEKIAIEIYGINYECEIIFAENFLIVKYIDEKKEKKTLIIPLNYSYPLKINKQNYFEVIIKNQISNNDKDFKFKFNVIEKRNTFYDKIYILTNSFSIKEEFNFIEEIGKGEFGIIYLATKKENKEEKKIINFEEIENITIKTNNSENIEKYAIKVLNKINLKKKELNCPFSIQRNEYEISKIFERISHPNIIRINNVLEDINNIYIVMEYCSKENQININELSNEEKLNKINQLIQGIKFLHNIGIIHRDLKLQNILIGNDNNIKIIDFNLSNIISPYEKINEFLGSYGYFSPEIIEKKSYSFETDFWNLGIISFYFLYNFNPFKNCESINEIKQFDLYKFLNDNCDNNINNSANSIKQIIISCLNFNVNERGKNI